MAQQVPFVGLTGGLGAGKSTALEVLRELGAETISSDDVVHELYDSPELRELLAARWGPEVAPDGSVDRAAVARRVFADGDERRWLEQLLWPLVGAKVGAWLEQAREREPPPLAAVVEVPLLFEAGLQDAYDATIAVLASEELRFQRADARGHEHVSERDARQLSQEEKAARATFVVRNDGTIEELRAQLSDVLGNLGA